MEFELIIKALIAIALLIIIGIMHYVRSVLVVKLMNFSLKMRIIKEAYNFYYEIDKMPKENLFVDLTRVLAKCDCGGRFIETKWMLYSKNEKGILIITKSFGGGSEVQICNRCFQSFIPPYQQ